MTGDLPPGLGHIVERFDHVAIAAERIEDVLPLVELIGGRFRNGGDNDAGGFRWIQFFLPGAGKVEVIAPLPAAGEGNFLVEFLHRRGPGVHHLTFKVGDLDAALEAARDSGFEVVGHDATTYPGWKEAFLHPKSTGGTLIQLTEFADRPPPDVSVADVLTGIPESD